MDVHRHKRPLRDLPARLKLWFQDAGTGFDWAFYIALFLSALVCIAGLVYALSQTEDPDYNPPRNAYYIGGTR